MKRAFERLSFVLAWVLALSVCQKASAVVLDWDGVTWTAGSLSNSYDVDPGTPGNDITVTMSGDVNRFTNDATSGVPTPAIDMTLTGGLSPVENSLQLAANLKTGSKIFVTVDFSALYLQGVQNVSFSIFDIDLEKNHDQIRSIYGIALDGTHVAATITNIGSAVTLNGAGLGQFLTGRDPSPDNSSNGNATISFGGTPITGFAFTWGNTNGAPFYQQISITDIYFIPVPEMSPAVPTIIVCVAAAAIARRRNR
jgi:hypothetical protein